MRDGGNVETFVLANVIEENSLEKPSPTKTQFKEIEEMSAASTGEGEQSSLIAIDSVIDHHKWYQATDRGGVSVQLMTNTSRNTRNSSMEDLREKSTQLESDLRRISDEVREVSKKHEDHLKRSDDNAKRMEERLAAVVTNQVKHASRGMEDKIASLTALIEKSLKLQADRSSNFEIGGTSFIPELGEKNDKTDNVRPKIVVIDDNERAKRNEAWSYMDLNEEEYAWGMENIRPKHAYNHFNPLPKIEFPYFDGEDPVNWVMDCNHYFEMYQIAPQYKSRMAVIHFSKDLKDWYRGIQNGNYILPWEVLVEEVFRKFKGGKRQHPIEEFKRCHQMNRVEEYIKQFEQIRMRVLQVSHAFSEEEFKVGFICGLKEELRGMVKLFKPNSLEEAYEYALQYEETQDTQQKRMKNWSKPTTLQPYSNVKKNNVEPKKEWSSQNYKPWQTDNQSKNKTMEQKKALGLCYKCNERYYPGHQCTLKTVNVISEQEEASVEITSSDEETKERGENEEAVEQAVISMHATNDQQKINSMKFKGHIKGVPICALIDSGSTHSFVNPEVIKGLELSTQQTHPMVVRVANGGKMVTDRKCDSLKFEIQGVPFEKDVRLLAVEGYDVILGLDWLVNQGPMKIDWGKGKLAFMKEGREVKLEVREEKAEIQLISHEMDLSKEMKRGSEIIIAQLFTVEQSETPQNIPNSFCHPLLMKYKEIFEEPTGLPPLRDTDHRIPLLPGSKPINLRPYRLSYFQKLELEKIVEELLKNSFIQPSSSPFASPILLVKKKDGGWRMCVDYRQLNTNTVKNKFPIPIIEDLLDELHGATIFSKIDLRSGYHQIKMNKNDVQKTAFRTHDGHYEFLVMPFGLTNAPATFQSLMNQVFKPYLRKFILVFFDDILVYSRDQDEHLQHLEMTLTVLKENKFFAKLSKCEFGVDKLEYLGHIISADGVSTDPKKIESMKLWPTPRNVKELRGFLGLTGYYRRFVQNYGVIARPLTEQLKKNAFHWNEEADKAFEQLKIAMTTAPVLAMPNFKLPFVLETDASDYGIGAVLMQNRKPLAFLSKCIGVKNQGLSTYEKEFLALLTAVKKWRHYLIGGQFVIKTDQISLKHLLEQKVNHMMQHKGVCKLLGLDYKIEYKKGIDNKVADALSRKPGQFEKKCFEESELQVVSELVPQWVEEMKASYVQDQWIQGLKTKIEKGEDENNKLTVHQELVRYKNRLCVGATSGWRNQLIKEVHDSHVGGHSGILSTYKRLKSMFYWPGMKDDVYQYVRNCENCQITKGEHVKTPGLLQPLPIPHEAWSSISMDFIVGLPKSDGKEVIWVVVDRLTKYAHFVSLSHSYNAASVAQAFIENIYKLHGLPSSIVSDRDPVFTSLFWKELMEKLGVKLNMGTAYHPQTDGQTERVNQCIEGYLRSMACTQPKKWNRWIPLAEWWYNTNYHCSIKTSPFQALYGYVPPQLPLGTPPRCIVQAVDSWMKERHMALLQLKENLRKAQERMKRYADENRSEREFKSGDWVYLKIQPYRQISVQGRGNSKLLPKYCGPFEILEKVGTVAYKLNLPVGSQIHPVVHVSQLKKRIGENQPVASQLPVFNPEQSNSVRPIAILGRRMIPRKNLPIPQILVQWDHQTDEEATWEDYEAIAKSFPDFILEAKENLMREAVSDSNLMRDGGNVETFVLANVIEENSLEKPSPTKTQFKEIEEMSAASTGEGEQSSLIAIDSVIVSWE
ncbi:hypothetical protein LUZ61_020042 [Rhynchospora tenuis]|uniref:Reverse transcriptase n=1 Tax=Rhynchospora tenuis TaxID=198213 RepID=A0AAD5ZCF1_9POAL|nr:hypothetical protein LUZ61_020042 [Rhynchospora tenuis]